MSSVVDFKLTSLENYRKIHGGLQVSDGSTNEIGLRETIQVVINFWIRCKVKYADPRTDLQNDLMEIRSYRPHGLLKYLK